MTTARARHSEGVLHMYLEDTAQPSPNLACFQLTFQLPAAFDLVFTSSGSGGGGGGGESHASRRAQLSGAALTSLAAQREAEFDSRFERTFPALAGAGSSRDSGEGEEAEGVGAALVGEVAKAALSNLVGSMGYFYGSSIVALAPGAWAPAGRRVG